MCAYVKGVCSKSSEAFLLNHSNNDRIQNNEFISAHEEDSSGCDKGTCENTHFSESHLKIDLQFRCNFPDYHTTTSFNSKGVTFSDSIFFKYEDGIEILKQDELAYKKEHLFKLPSDNSTIENDHVNCSSWWSSKVCGSPFVSATQFFAAGTENLGSICKDQEVERPHFGGDLIVSPPRRHKDFSVRYIVSQPHQMMCRLNDSANLPHDHDISGFHVSLLRNEKLPEFQHSTPKGNYKVSERRSNKASIKYELKQKGRCKKINGIKNQKSLQTPHRTILKHPSSEQTFISTKKSTSKKDFDRKQDLDIKKVPNKVHFKAKQALVLKKKPFIPKTQKAMRAYATILPTKNASEKRMTSELEKATRLQKEKEFEEQEIQRLRKSMTFKAKDVPSYKRFVIKPSTKPLTVAQSPKLSTKTRRRCKLKS